MNHRPWRACFCAVVGILATADAVQAQRAGRAAGASISRPAQSGPSVSIGGTFTSQAINTLQAPRRDVALLGQDQYEFTRGQRSHRGGRFTSILPVGTKGLDGVLSAPGGTPLSAHLDRSGEVVMLSGLGVVTDLERGLPFFPEGGLPAANAFLYSPRPPRDARERFFDLKPVAEDAPSPLVPIRTYAEALEERTNWRVAVAERDGLAAFKAGTVEPRDVSSGRFPNCQTCDQDLIRANQKFELVRDLDADNWLALTIMAHIALERDRPTTASIYLEQAFNRNPDLFSEGPLTLDQYFGDVGSDGRSQFLRAQVRRYARIAELNPDDVTAVVIEMYCAWRMDDKPLVRDLFQRFTRLSATLRTIRPEIAKMVEAMNGSI